MVEFVFAFQISGCGMCCCCGLWVKTVVKAISLIFFLFFCSCLSNCICDLVLGWVLRWFWCL